MPQCDKIFRYTRPGRFRQAHIAHEALGYRRGEPIRTDVFRPRVASFASAGAGGGHFSHEPAPRGKGAAADGRLSLVLLGCGLFGLRLRKAEALLAASRRILAKKR